MTELQTTPYKEGNLKTTLLKKRRNYQEEAHKVQTRENANCVSTRQAFSEPATLPRTMLFCFFTGKETKAGAKHRPGLKASFPEWKKPLTKGVKRNI